MQSSAGSPPSSSSVGVSSRACTHNENNKMSAISAWACKGANKELDPRCLRERGREGKRRRGREGGTEGERNNEREGRRRRGERERAQEKGERREEEMR